MSGTDGQTQMMLSVSVFGHFSCGASHHLVPRALHAGGREERTADAGISSMFPARFWERRITPECKNKCSVQGILSQLMHV